MSHVATRRSPVWQPKRTVLLATVIYAALTGPLLVLVSEEILGLVRFALLIGDALFVLAWCYFDAEERNKPFHSGWRIAIVVFGVLALFIYLFTSRGAKQGYRASLLALLFCICLAIIMFATAALVGLFVGLE